MSEYVLHPCPTCGDSRRVRRRDIGRAKQCRRCHLSQIAPKGYAATKAKHGAHFATRHVRLYRLDNPSNLEQIVTTWLDCQGAAYEREYWLDCGAHVYLVDFVLCAAGNVFAVEVNGTWAHSHHAERDTRKVEALQSHGFDVIVLSESDVLTGAYTQKLSALQF